MALGFIFPVKIENYGNGKLFFHSWLCDGINDGQLA